MDEERHEIRHIEIRCEHCQEWFRSGVLMGDDQTFDTTMLEGNLQNCPRCGKMTGCSKANIRWMSEDGQTGFVGTDTTR